MLLKPLLAMLMHSAGMLVTLCDTQRTLKSAAHQHCEGNPCKHPVQDVLLLACSQLRYLSPLMFDAKVPARFESVEQALRT